MSLKSKLLEEVRLGLLRKDYTKTTCTAYSDWIYRFITFHDFKDASEIQEKHIRLFLEFLADEKEVALSTQYQAFQAICFLVKKVLRMELNTQGIRPFPAKLVVPKILPKAAIEQLLDHMEGEAQIMAALLYGSGLRIRECVSLRVRNLDFKEMNIIIFRPNRTIDRKTPMPFSLKISLERQIEKARIRLAENLQKKRFGGVILPQFDDLISTKRRTSIDWQYIFPSKKFQFCPSTKTFLQVPLSTSFLQKAVKRAVIEAKLDKKTCCSTLRHSFAAHLLTEGYDIKAIQRMMGHKDARTTMVYLQAIDREDYTLHSPLDRYL